MTLADRLRQVLDVGSGQFATRHGPQGTLPVAAGLLFFPQSIGGHSRQVIKERLAARVRVLTALLGAMQGIEHARIIAQVAQRFRLLEPQVGSTRLQGLEPLCGSQGVGVAAGQHVKTD